MTSLAARIGGGGTFGVATNFGPNTLYTAPRITQGTRQCRGMAGTSFGTGFANQLRNIALTAMALCRAFSYAGQLVIIRFRYRRLR
jgi:hypothetical protein